jgi:hypothetical protein
VAREIVDKGIGRVIGLDRQPILRLQNRNLGRPLQPNHLGMESFAHRVSLPTEDGGPRQG